MFEDFYLRLVSILDTDPSMTLKRKDLDNKKEEIFRYVIDSLPSDSTDGILQGFERVLKHPDIRIIRENYASKFNAFQAKRKFYESTSDDSYKFTMRMPGLLLQTNSKKIEGSDTGWSLTYYDFFFKDYVMTSESRKVNTWAFIVAGLLLLVALGGLFGSQVRKR
jgi:hypothetical protein